MARTTRPASDRILAVLKRGPQRGLTAAEIATRGDLNLNTTRTVIWALREQGNVAAVEPLAGERGRPANRYILNPFAA